MERTAIIGFIIALVATLLNLTLVLCSRHIADKIASMHDPSARQILKRKGRSRAK